MRRQLRSALCTSVALAAMAASVPAIAQEITSSVRGVVTNPAGAPATGQSVTITDTRTGASKTTTTNDNGNFSFRSLTVGGPYTIKVTSEQYQNAVITDINAGLGGASSFTIALNEVSPEFEEISVTASRVNTAQVAVGPSSTFDLTSIIAAPSISRQIRDVIRIDPRVNIGRGSGGEGFGISCAGGNPRSNSFTIDGVRASDPFGLNSSGNISRSTFPIPYDSISATSVEFSPVNVEYGAFTGCNINVVSKSGTNEFHGSAFYLYNNDSLTGTDIDGVDQTGGAEFTRKNWGAEIGGPIVEDKLFFYASYEETTTADVQNEGPIGGGFNVETGVTQDEAERIRDILSGSYGRDVGAIVRTLPNTSLRYFGRIDWQITDNHKLEASYSRLEEDRVLGDAINSGRGEFTFEDNFQTRGSVSNVYRLALLSDWSDNLSTEIRASRNVVNDSQGPILGGERQETNVPRIAIGASFANEFFAQDFASGPGIFRSANQLDTTVDQFKAKADYVTGDHTVTVGYELDSLDVFNLFAINATGTIFFNSIDDLEAGAARNIRIGASFSGDIVDAAAAFKRTVHTLYIQDEWQFSDNLLLTGGLRYDFYKSDDNPISNPVFNAKFGFDNVQAYDGLSAFQPRIGLVYNLPEQFGETTITAGFATFSGGDPTVWFANAFQNFGGALGVGDALADGLCDPSVLNVLDGGFNGIPQCVIQGAQNQALGNEGAVAATDPNLKQSKVNRLSLGIQHYTQDTGIDFFDNWTVQFDFIYANNVNAYDFVDLSLTRSGETAPDGRPIYVQVDPRLAGCNATFAGIREGFTGVTDECISSSPPSSGNQNILITNAVNGGGSSKSFAAQFSKRFELSETATLDVRTGYAFSDNIVGNPGGSSTAGSNFEEVVTDDFNNGNLGQATFNNKHNITLGLTYRNEFWDGLATTVSAFYRVRSGTALSYVFDANTSNGAFGDSDREARSQLYVPTGPNDPLADTSGIDQDAFFAFLASSGLDEYAGEIAPRGGFSDPWASDLDLRFSQELPGFFGNDGFEVFVNFENFLNFVDSSAGKKDYVRPGDVNGALPVVAASIVDGQYVYSNFNGADSVIQIAQDLNDTLWRVQVGVKYKF
ncbi:MAG: TonB-dependent receptor [Kordiimonadaceae bacterium]|nr:TonB-dependent receptor [Kordiimonadaceae bacterium]